MLIVRKTNAYLGFILALIAITVCPFLKVPIKGNWNLHQTDSRLFFISLVIFALIGFCLLLKQLRAFRFFAIVALIWSVLMAAAVYFKSNNYFGSKFFDKVLAKTIHYQWGWIVLLVAVLLLATSVRKEQLIVQPQPDSN
ncbi:MAG: hypothetical protein REI78_10185 [Pedobacter sp.]|nr:hypothetical protein [Pedobacter sp.]MDQ8053385.1 hypothetical protein [Pedobacter sp.]